jgi:hypothetical protein
LPNLPWIESLSVSECNNLNLSQWHNLTELHINNFKRKILPPLSTDLITLTLTNCAKLTNIVFLLQCIKLTSITIKQCPRLNRPLLKSLKQNIVVREY